jgi:replicative DNA helicase
MEGLLEFRVLAILRKKENYLRYREHVKLELFKAPELQIIYKIIRKFHTKYNKPVLSIKNLRMLTERSVPSDDWPTYITVIRRIKVNHVDDDEIVKDCIVKFAQGQAIRQIAQDLLYAIEHDPDSLDLSDLKGKIDHAISIESSTQEQELEYVATDHDRLSPERDPIRISTGLSRDIDQAIGGGLAGGELGIVLAPTGRGKTLALVNIGATALTLGKRVLHVTLEIRARAVARRYDLRLTRSTYEELRAEPSILHAKQEELIKRGSYLLVKDYSHIKVGVEQIGGILERYKNRGEPFHLMIVDYADLLKSTQRYKDKRNEISEISQELRMLAGLHDIPVWTASQTNRKAFEKRVVNMSDFDESIGKAFVADVILTLSQSIEEQEEMMMRIYVAKLRSGSKKPIISVICDPDRMLIKSYKRGENDEDVNGNRPRAISDRSSPYKKNAGVQTPDRST